MFQRDNQKPPAAFLNSWKKRNYVGLWSTSETDSDIAVLLSHRNLFDALVDTCLYGFDGLFWWSWNTSIDVTSCKHQVCIHKIRKVALYIYKAQE